MPKAQEICTVTAYGEKYNNWKTVEVTRSFDSDIVIHCMLTVAEISSNAAKLSDLKLKPGDPATVTLAGRKVLVGFVYLRQAYTDANQHGVQIGIASKTQNMIASTVDCKPGQYTNKTLIEICNAITNPVGVTFKLSGNPDGANIPFKRFAEHMGERRIDCITRACQMRNIHLVEGSNGELIGFRGYGTDSGLSIEQGKYLRGRIMLQTWDQVDEIKYNGSDHGNDSGDANRSTEGVARIPGPRRPARFAAPQAGTDKEMQMLANHEKDWIYLKMVDGDVAMPGWLTPNGSLWMEHVTQLITVNSSLLLPQNTMKFMIKGVVHRQSSDGGTTTDVMLCDTLGVGAGRDPVRLEWLDERVPSDL
jgi:prophage tail gpP-like protein